MVITKMMSLASMLAIAGCATAPDTRQRFEFTRPEMGVPFRIVLYATSQAAAESAASAAFSRIEKLNAALSDYDTDSELSRLSQTGGQGNAVKVSDDLWRVLERSQQIAIDTGGAFDITCGPVVSLWRKARREKKLPDSAKLEEARQAVGYNHLRLDAGTRTAQLLVPYMRLDLGAIAKGYAVDEALDVLRVCGIESALVSGGGDMAVSDAPPGSKGWRIELAPLDVTNAPTEFVRLRNAALATSGDVFQHVEIDGTRYSHIVDPRTGLGLTDHSLVVVIARDCTTADCLSTTVSVLGPERGLEFAGKYEACVRIVRKPADCIEVHKSSCFRRFVEPKPSPHQ